MALHFCLLTGQLLTFQLEAGKDTGHGDPTRLCLYRDPTYTAPHPAKDAGTPIWATFQSDGFGSFPSPHFLILAPLPGPSPFPPLPRLKVSQY